MCRMKLYRYRWNDNSKRKTLYNRVFKVITRGKANSALVEFIDNNQREIISRNAMRKIK
jgi:hypothetical protein